MALAAGVMKRIADRTCGAGPRWRVPERSPRDTPTQPRMMRRRMAPEAMSMARTTMTVSTSTAAALSKCR